MHKFLYMNLFKYVFLVTILLLIGCGEKSGSGNNKKEGGVASTSNSAANMDLTGRKFLLDGTASVLPEAGGLDFITFENNEVANLKTGDIVESMNIMRSNDTLYLTGSQTGSKRMFVISSAGVLLSPDGSKWLLQ